MQAVKMLVVLILAVLLAGCGGSEKRNDSGQIELSGEIARSSYAIGFNYGANMRRLAGELDIDALVAGVNDAYLGKEARIEAEEVAQRMQQFQQDVMRRDQARLEEESSRNIAEGEAFRKANGQKSEVTETASGLQYAVIKPGDGASPKPSDRVTVHYHGTLVDGTVFDSSVQRGEPVTFRLDQLIPGWVEGIQLMKVGAKYRFVIPPELAYGKRGSPPRIGPDATLVFEVELLGIEK
ncbi:MAG: FKBP-type peptidyl-prolyl cis-trans isomerase [Acidobacteriota bacterium]|jgi:FKBP-type peptidyl-prolyl cis-trans isomerase|nr:FKBP-type peptidyl-prolyl cis-trans isomerase [Acidobacteriota bacterium]